MGELVHLPPGTKYAGVRADNTGLISQQPGGMPMFAARNKITLNGLSAVGGMGNLADVSDPSMSNDGSILNTLTSPGVMPAINSEAVFLTNLVRGWTGQAPLSIAASAPAVNVGITPDTMLMIGGLGIVALLAMSKGGKKKRK